MNDWIKCTERLPDEWVEVITINKDKEIDIDYVVFGKETFWSNSSQYIRYPPLYWMEKPKPPKEML